MSQEFSLQNSAAAADEQTPQWPTAARYLAAAFLALAMGVLLVFLVPIISTVASGFIFAFLLFLPARALVQHTKIRYPLAVVLIYLLLVVLVVLVGFGAYSLIHNNASELSASLEVVVEELETHDDEINQLIADLGANAGVWLAETLQSVVGGVCRRAYRRRQDCE